MKDWFGILIFVAIAIANIMLEQNRQQKKKAARRAAAPASPLPPVRKRAPVQRRAEVQPDRPATEEPTLQEALQSLFENSKMEPRKEVPPPLPRQPEAELPRPQVRVPAPVVQPVPQAPTPQVAQPILPSVTEKSSAKWLSRSDFRARDSLRRAVIMSEVLAKPKGFQ